MNFVPAMGWSRQCSQDSPLSLQENRLGGVTKAGVEAAGKLLRSQQVGIPPMIFAVGQNVEPPSVVCKGVGKEDVHRTPFEAAEQLVSGSIGQNNLTENNIDLRAAENRFRGPVVFRKEQTPTAPAEMVDQSCGLSLVGSD